MPAEESLSFSRLVYKLSRSAFISQYKRTSSLHNIRRLTFTSRGYSFNVSKVVMTMNHVLYDIGLSSKETLNRCIDLLSKTSLRWVGRQGLTEAHRLTL